MATPSLGRPVAPESNAAGIQAFPMPEEWDATRRTRFLIVTVELALVLLAIRLLGIEESYGLVSITPVILVGFVIHASIPRGYRLWAFVATTMVAIGVVFGVRYGGLLIAMALGLIGLCHLPIPLKWRVAFLAGAGAGLAAMRAEWIPGPGLVSTVLLPILGAMFMFRLVLYLYYLSHETEPGPISQRIAYFFLLPNVCFPLFPVVDYQAFRRTYYDSEPSEIYQKGVLWMVRGITHILLYRLIYHEFLLAPAEVTALPGVVMYMLATYGLYLRISGQFHLIVGILCLFGFNLPETHHLYFLATGFNDYWRRINIYWKDFMMKVFYFPAMLKFRRWGMKPAVVLSTIVVFTATWLLHSYQWFWLQGTFPLTVTDALFWGILCAGVVVNSLREADKGRRRKPAAGFSIYGSLGQSARTVGMFAFICVLWSLWSSSSVGEWTDMVSHAADSGAATWALLGLGICAAIGAGVVIQWALSRGFDLTLVGNQPAFGRSVAYVGSLCIALVLLGSANGAGGAGGITGDLAAAVRGDRLNKADLASMDRGYYEGLLEAPRFTEALWRIQGAQPDDWVSTRQAAFVRERPGLLEFDLSPSASMTYKNAEFVVNRWGMRDDDYAERAAAGTFRIALLGASYTMGAGVEQDSIFEARVEAMLNSDRPTQAHDSYEILNFAVGSYSVLQNAVVFSEKALPFEPDVLLFTVHSSEASRLSGHLTRVLRSSGTAGVPELDALLREAGIGPNLSAEEIRIRLEPRLDEFLAWSFRALAESSRAAGVLPAMVFVPTTEETPAQAESAAREVLAIAEREGFLTMSIHDAFAGLRAREIQLAAWDRHPSRFGHATLADELFRVLMANAESLGFYSPSSTTESIDAADRN